MNLNEIRDTVQTEAREVEFKPVGTPTGWFFKLRHESAAEVQEVMRKFQAKVRDLTLKRKTTAYQNLVAVHEDQLRIAHVEGWRWEKGVAETKGRPDFTRKELSKLLKDEQLSYHIKKFIDEEVGSLDDFLSKSEDSSESA
jgi:DNA primase catalytic subunit